jgi:hypothetical protein
LLARKVFAELTFARFSCISMSLWSANRLVGSAAARLETGKQSSVTDMTSLTRYGFQVPRYGIISGAHVTRLSQWY